MLTKKTDKNRLWKLVELSPNLGGKCSKLQCWPFSYFLVSCLCFFFVMLADTGLTPIYSKRSSEDNKIFVHFLCNAQKTILWPETITLFAEIFKFKHSLHKWDAQLCLNILIFCTFMLLSNLVVRTAYLHSFTYNLHKKLKKGSKEIHHFDFKWKYYFCKKHVECLLYFT